MMGEMVMQDIWFPLGVVLALASVFLLWAYERNFGSYRLLQLPPSPSGAWPTVGHLPLFGTLPHRSLLDLAKKYGPVMYMRLGSVPVVVVSSADMLREFFHVNDAIMASRPVYSALVILGFNRQDVASQPYGELWRDMRKLFTQELLSMKRLNELQAVRRREVLLAVESVSYRATQSANSSVNMRQELTDMTFNNTTQMLVSKRYFGPKLESEVRSEEISHLLDEVLILSATFEIGD